MGITATGAANRFGLGARPGELQQIGSDPRGWLLGQLGPAPAIAAYDGLPGSADYLATLFAYQQQRRQQRMRREAGNGADRPEGGDGRRSLRQGVQRELVLRQGVAVASATSFRERLVRFWSNHFAISVDKFRAGLFAAPMEREAIRPHVTGRFADLLLAVERHPGMLLYLDNERSIGDDSRLAQLSRRRASRNPQSRSRGLNENLAREILELHTLGVDGGYTQADVVEFARAITGWGVVRPGARGGSNAFSFRSAAHEPGTRRVLGKTFAQSGEQQGVAILHMLALHPATANHLSLQLARHFVADEPPPALVARMARTYLDTGGELAAVYRTLIQDDAAWSPSARKFKNPDDFAVSALRATGLDDAASLGLSLQLQAQLGRPVFQPRSPAGFGDIAADWGGPDALFKRVQAAQALADRLPDMQGSTPLALAQAALGPTLDAQTATALRRAESVQQGVALLLASPVFQWRA